MQRNKNQTKKNNKQLRKPISGDFDPKRLAINFQPPMIIIEYLVIDTGKLYHHKMRLDSILRKLNVQRQDVLNYIKTKHYLYFLNGKVKDVQILKFIDKILIKMGKMKHSAFVNKNILNDGNNTTGQQSNTVSYSLSSKQENQKVGPTDDDFDYLNDDQQYDQDYQDYQEDQVQIKTPFTQYKNMPFNNKNENKKQQSQSKPNKNAFLTYCQQYQQEEDDQGGQAQWDLDMDQNADFV